MIPTPTELIKEAINSGSEGEEGRQFPVGSIQRYIERMDRRRNVLEDMKGRGQAPRLPKKYVERSMEDANRLSSRGAPKDTPKPQGHPRLTLPGQARPERPKATAPKAMSGHQEREAILAKGRGRLDEFKGKMKAIDEKYKPTIPAKKSNTGRNVAIGLGTAALAGGAYALYKRKKAREAKAAAEGQAKTAAKTPAWTRSEGKSESGGLNAEGVASYRRANPGSKLQTAVTTKPSKLKPGSKAAKRRKSFCARMSGMPGPMKDEKGRPTRKALSLRKWNC